MFWWSLRGWVAVPKSLILYKQPFMQTRLRMMSEGCAHCSWLAHVAWVVGNEEQCSAPGKGTSVFLGIRKPFVSELQFFVRSFFLNDYFRLLKWQTEWLLVENSQGAGSCMQGGGGTCGSVLSFLSSIWAVSVQYTVLKCSSLGVFLFVASSTFHLGSGSSCLREKWKGHFVFYPEELGVWVVSLNVT